MSTRRAFSGLVAEMLPDAQARIARRVNQSLAEMRLSDLRDNLNVSQEIVGAELGVKQAAVSRLGGRADMLISTLRDYVTALGGELDIVARFDEGTFKIAGLEEE